MKRARSVILGLAGAASLLAGCHTGTAPEDSPVRSYLMGFSAIPPRNDQALAVQALELWTQRADAAILHIDPPWIALLDGLRADSAVRLQHGALVDYYRGKGLRLVATIDVTDGLARDREAPALRDAGRSITEPAVQAVYRQYVAAFLALVRPDYLGLAAETNLIRAAAPAPVYAAVVRMTSDAAAEVAATKGATKLYVSVQAEVAWGGLGGAGSFIGVETDRRDFPFIEALGISSYPYFAWPAPEAVPLDYFSRLAGGKPVLMVEGGWSSASFGGVASSPASQTRWLRRLGAILAEARAVAVTQLTFTDLDVATFPAPTGATLVPFASLGLVDTELRPKPALTTWDSLFALPLRR